MSDGLRLEKDVEDLLLGSGVAVFTKNRPVGGAGFSHGGVAICMRDSMTKFKVFDFPNPEQFEVLALSGSLSGATRKFVLICVYVPPNYAVPRGRACLQHVSDLVLEAKRRSPGAYICIGGDFNQWEIAAALADYPDLEEVPTPPTRNDRRIDKIFTNWGESIFNQGCLPPLEAERADGAVTSKSDHSIQYAYARINRKEKVIYEKFTYRPFNEKAAELFVSDIKTTDWAAVLQTDGSDLKAAQYQAIIDKLMDKHFPKKTVRRKSSDLPWLNDTAKKKIKKKKAVYRAEGRSDRWRQLRLDLDTYLDARKTKYLEKQKNRLTDPNASRNFFRNIKNYKTYERPKSFNVSDLRPNSSDIEVADEVAQFFNSISSEFEPLQEGDIPSTYHRDIPKLTESQVADMVTK